MIDASSSRVGIRPGSARAWLSAARPKTLAAALVPVVVGLSLSFVDVGADGFLVVPAALCLLFASIMQIAANFVNDYFDYVRGNDGVDRLGPRRACAMGWVMPAAMKWAIGITIVTACIVGLPLVIYGGMEMISVGVACVVFCFLYTTRLSYMGLGDVLVVVFFGLVPVTMTYYVQTRSVTWEVFLLSIACGLVVDTLLVVNNYRDFSNDLRSGKRTLITRIGIAAGGYLYLFLGIVATVIVVMTYVFRGRYTVGCLSIVYIVLHLVTYRRMTKLKRGRRLNYILGETSRNILIFGLLVAAGLLLPLSVNAGNSTTERDHVIVTLNDGTTVEGYITTYWSEPGLFKSYNRSFKMTSTPGGADEKRYEAADVRSVVFVEKSADGGDDDVISADVANPTTFRPHKVTRQFVHVEDSTYTGTIYWWNGIDRQQMQLGSMQVSTIYGVRLRGDDIIIPFMTGNVVSLNAMRIVYKDKDKKLVDYVDRRILKGGRQMWRRLAQQPALLLDIVREYYGTDINE